MFFDTPTYKFPDAKPGWFTKCVVITLAVDLEWTGRGSHLLFIRFVFASDVFCRVLTSFCPFQLMFIVACCPRGCQKVAHRHPWGVVLGKDAMAGLGWLGWIPHFLSASGFLIKKQCRKIKMKFRIWSWAFFYISNFYVQMHFFCRSTKNKHNQIPIRS